MSKQWLASCSMVFSGDPTPNQTLTDTLVTSRENNSKYLNESKVIE